MKIDTGDDMKAVWWLCLGGQYSGTRYECTSACQEFRLKTYTWLLTGKYMHLCPHSESMPRTLLLWTTSSKTTSHMRSYSAGQATSVFASL